MWYNEFAKKHYQYKEIRAIDYHTTILRQIIEIFPRHEFEAIAEGFHAGQKFRSFNRWSQLMVMLIGQLSGRKSLRDLDMNVSAQTHKLYHLAIKPCSRATLAKVNEKQPANLYETIFFKLLQRCRQFAPKHRFKFNGKLYLLDATVVDLCLSVFPWAKFRETKGALKIHVGLDGDGYLQKFVNVTEGMAHEITWAKSLKLPRGSMALFDMGFTDYGWYQTLMGNGVYFVTRLIPRHDTQFGAHADLNSPHRLSAPCLPEIQNQTRPVDAADLAVITAQSLRTAQFAQSIQAT